MLSSVKRRWEILGAPLQTEIPLMCPIASSFFNIADKPSTHMRKRYGEIGFPCRRPLDGMILPLGSSLIMQYDTVVTHTIIKAIQFSWKSNLPIIASK